MIPNGIVNYALYDYYRLTASIPLSDQSAAAATNNNCEQKRWIKDINIAHCYCLIFELARVEALSAIFSASGWLDERGKRELGRSLVTHRKVFAVVVIVVESSIRLRIRQEFPSFWLPTWETVEKGERAPSNTRSREFECAIDGNRWGGFSHSFRDECTIPIVFPLLSGPALFRPVRYEMFKTCTREK